MKGTIDQFPKRFVYRLSLAIASRCLTYRHYIPWTDRVIGECDRPPTWLCDLAVTKYRPDAVRILEEEAFNEPFESFDSHLIESLGFQWIRYERGEISWATFLSEAGSYTDGSSCGIECEYFYSMLNDLEEAEFDKQAENRQRTEVEVHLSKTIASARELVAVIKDRG